MLSIISIVAIPDSQVIMKEAVEQLRSLVGELTALAKLKLKILDEKISSLDLNMDEQLNSVAKEALELLDIVEKTEETISIADAISAELADQLSEEYEFRQAIGVYIDPHPDWPGHREQAIQEAACCAGPARPDEYHISGGDGTGKGLKIGEDGYVSLSELKELYKKFL